MVPNSVLISLYFDDLLSTCARLGPAGHLVARTAPVGCPLVAAAGPPWCRGRALITFQKHSQCDAPARGERETRGFYFLSRNDDLCRVRGETNNTAVLLPLCVICVCGYRILRTSYNLVFGNTSFGC